MPLDAEIYGFRQRLSPSLVVSAAMHAALLASLFLIPALLSRSWQNWGNNGSGGPNGGAMSATLVSGIPLPPKPNAKPENVLATESPGLSRSVPPPPVKEKVEEKAIELPGREAKIKKKLKAKEEVATAPPPREIPREQPHVVTPTRLPSNLPPPKTPPPANEVPFGEGGPVAGPYTTVDLGKGAGGLKFGEGGTGNFGSLYGWYADIVARKVHQAWESEVNPGIKSANRVYILFDIARNGSPSNIHIGQSSGVPSLDISAMRALQRIDTFGPLPAGYRGSYVSVEFWFDYRR